MLRIKEMNADFFTSVVWITSSGAGKCDNLSVFSERLNPMQHCKCINHSNSSHKMMFRPPQLVRSSTAASPARIHSVHPESTPQIPSLRSQESRSV